MSTPFDPAPGPRPPRARLHRRGWVRGTVIAVVALIVGAAAASGAPPSEPDAAPAPTATTTVTAPAAPAATVTATRTVEAAPAPAVTTTRTVEVEVPEQGEEARAGGPEPGSGGTDPQFGTCGEANDAGYGPYTRGVDEEYDWYTDRDDDGVVCER